METTLLEDQTGILLAALGEITPDHYQGPRPPPKSYEPPIRGREILGFRWESPFFSDRMMYFKFGLNGSDENRRAFICSIHVHREQPR